MCRFYALRATAPTRVECCLVQAPNSLLAQSRQDLRGFENADGWGIAAHGRPAAGGASTSARAPDDGASASARAPDDGASASARAPDDGASTSARAHDDGASASGRAPDDGASASGRAPDDGASASGRAPDDGASASDVEPDGGASVSETDRGATASSGDSDGGASTSSGETDGEASGAAAEHGGGGWAIERQPHPAHDGLRFRAAAARTQATTVLAHVRHATVGTVALENTHPFRHGDWAFVHNGTVPYFVDVRERLLAAMTAGHRAAIRGSTDSEHLFHLVLSTVEQAPERPLLTSLRQALRQVVGWCRELGQEPHLGLNVLLTDGQRMVGSRWQRSLHYVERVGRTACPVCGQPHAALAANDYRALLIASEPITLDPWPEVPERSVFEVTPQIRLHTLPLAPA